MFTKTRSYANESINRSDPIDIFSEKNVNIEFEGCNLKRIQLNRFLHRHFIFHIYNFFYSIFLQDRIVEDAPPNCTHRKLAAFDFDHTIVDDNTDIVVRDLIKSKISDEVTKLYKRSGWIPYMQEIFHILHAEGFTKSQIKDTIEAIPEVAGIRTLIKELYDTNTTDIIIISDSNSMFIKLWCDYNDVSKYIKHIYTNHAHFTDDDILKVQPYHHQLDCRLSSENLCKGSILENFVRNQFEQKNIIYDKIFYVGDGHNDICPVLRLGDYDCGYARKGYRMQKEIEKKNLNLSASVEIWTDGRDLKELIFQRI